MDIKEKISELLAKISELETAIAAENPPQRSINGFLKFNKNEILQMPKTFRKEIRAQGCTAHIRKRIDGQNNYSYEIRYNRNGYAVSASATTLDEAKRRFIDAITYKGEKHGVKNQ